MSRTLKTFVALATLAVLALPLQSFAHDDDHGRWGRDDERREWRHDDRGNHWGHRRHRGHEREVIYLRSYEPVYRERIIERAPRVYQYPQPAVVISLPPVVIPF